MLNIHIKKRREQNATNYSLKQIRHVINKKTGIAQLGVVRKGKLVITLSPLNRKPELLG